MLARVNEGLSKRFGEGKWALALSAQGVLLDRKLVAARGVDRLAIEAEGKRLLLEEPGIAAVTTRTELESGNIAARQFAEQLKRTWYPARSADLQITLKEYWMFGANNGYASTAWLAIRVRLERADPFYGPAWVKAARVDQRVEVADIAPTLARILAVPAPSTAEGKPLPLR